MTSEQSWWCRGGGQGQTGSSLPSTTLQLPAKQPWHKDMVAQGTPLLPGCIPLAPAWLVTPRMYLVSLLRRDRLIEQLYGEIAALKEELENFKAEVGTTIQWCHTVSAHVAVQRQDGTRWLTPGMGLVGWWLCPRVDQVVTPHLSCLVRAGFCIPSAANPAQTGVTQVYRGGSPPLPSTLSASPRCIWGSAGCCPWGDSQMVPAGIRQCWCHPRRAHGARCSCVVVPASWRPSWPSSGT